MKLWLCLLLTISFLSTTILCLHLRYPPNELNPSGETIKTSSNVEDLKNAGDYQIFISKLVDNIKKDNFINEIRNEFKRIPKDESSLEIKCEAKNIPVSQLRPTQSEISIKDSLGWVLKGKSYTDYFKDGVIAGSKIVTYNSKFVIDGHHRWSQIYMINPKANVATINCEDVKKTKDQPFATLRKFQAAVVAVVGSLPSSSVGSGDNVYDKKDRTVLESEISSLILKDETNKTRVEILNQIIGDINTHITEEKDEATGIEIKKIIGNKVQQKKLLTNYVLNNILHFQKEAPILKGASPRKFMPQLDSAEKFYSDDGLNVIEKLGDGKSKKDKDDVTKNLKGKKGATGLSEEEKKKYPYDLKSKDIIKDDQNPQEAVINLMQHSNVYFGKDKNDEKIK